jgi:hypothetical protein
MTLVFRARGRQSFPLRQDASASDIKSHEAGAPEGVHQARDQNRRGQVRFVTLGHWSL